MARYNLTLKTWYIKDEASVDFHVGEKDYFATLAAIIGLWPLNHEPVVQSRQEIYKDLLYLQNNYDIVSLPRTVKAKKINKNKTPKGKLQNQ